MKKIFAISCVLLAIACIVLFRINLRQSERIKYLEQNLPYAVAGEKIAYFDAIGINDKDIDAATLNAPENEKPFLIFLFQQGCTPCNKNLYYWRKMAEILKNDARTIGVSLESKDDAEAFTRQAGLNFSFFVPIDIPKFKQEMKIRMNVAQTILYYKGEILLINIGELKGNEYAKFLTTARKISKSNKTKSL